MEISKKDFNILVINSVRYAINRHSYMPNLIADIICENKEFLTDNNKNLIIEEIDNEENKKEKVWFYVKDQLRKDNHESNNYS